MLVENQASSDTPFLFEAVIYYTPLTVKSRQVRMRTGVRMIEHYREHYVAAAP